MTSFFIGQFPELTVNPTGSPTFSPSPAPGTNQEVEGGAAQPGSRLAA
jgi:hypothetical protein